MLSLPTEPGITIRRIYIAHLMDIPFIDRTQCRMDTDLFTTPRTVHTVVMQTAYGPYGSATRAASYNPYTGTYKRALPSQLLTAGKALGRPTTPTPEPTRQRIRDPVPPRSGGNPTFRTEINPRTRNTTPPRKEPSDPCKARRAERQSGLPPPTAMLRWARLRAETCMPGRTETSTRTPAPAGKNMTTVLVPGTP